MVKYIKRLIADVKKYRHYLAYSVKSNLKAELSNTVLGYFWWLLDPLLYMVIYTFLVQVIFKRATPAFPVYVFCALLPWKLATKTLSGSTTCIKSNASIIKQVYLPKFILPLVLLLTNTIKLLFGLLLILVMLLIFKIAFTWHMIEFIPVLFVFILFYYSLATLFSHFGVLFQDLQNLTAYILMFWFFSSPAMWDLGLLPESWHKIIWLNPNVTFFMSFRNVFMYGKSPYYLNLLILLAISLVITFIGIVTLYRSDKNYSKVL